MKAQTSEIFVVADDVKEVKCDGGGGALGHPVVWYTFDGKGVAECLYCDRLFVKKSAEKAYKSGQAA